MAAHVAHTAGGISSRERILDAAVTVLAEEGYRNMTMARIQEITGLSRGLVAYYFGSKRGLVEAVVESIRDGYTPEIGATLGTDRLNGLESVLRVLDRYCFRLATGPARTKAVLLLTAEAVSEMPELQPVMQDLNGLLRDQLRDLIDRGLDDGSVRDGLDPLTQANLCQAMLHGVALLWLLDPKTVNLEAARLGLLAAVRRNLAA